MASKKFIEVQEFTDEDLINELVETQTHFKKMKFDHAIKGLDNPLNIRAVRRDISRLSTEVRRRELAKETSGSRTRVIARRRKKNK